MKRTIPLMLVVCLCMTALFGCAAKHEILPDVKEEYGISSKAEDRIAEMFDAFDKAFERLGKNPSDRAFYEYAEAVSSAIAECLDEIDEKYDVYIDELDTFDLDAELYDYKEGSGSGERCAEAALNMVEECSRFFYGVHWFTEEQLDSLG